MTLITKYRPEDFDEVYGNHSMIDSLKSAVLNEDRRPNTYLLHGPSGCGKTTLARIISTHLGCDKPKEYNISDTRGIDAARSIIEKVWYHTFGVARVLILNECHMATKEFQNAVLEVLEEPPPDTYFILCTTEPEKLLKTILTRCTQFQVSTLTNKIMRELISDVADAEEVELDPDAIRTISKAAEGSPRSGLAILSKIIDLDEDAIEEVVESVRTSEQKGIDLCRALMKRAKWGTIAGILKEITDEPESVRYQVMGYFATILLKSGDVWAAYVLAAFTETNFMYSKKPGLILTCYQLTELTE